MHDEYIAGVLDGCGRIYPHALAVASQNGKLLERLHRRNGGHIEGNRWIIRRADRRTQILLAWFAGSLTRQPEIAAELRRIGAGELLDKLILSD